ncbi:MAG: nucleotidyltransferase domain-containing protein [Anaerolineae bacterium]|nr:nucleotidyltransferase domain-containing protein [Anaerolineae bacterium]
MRDKTKMVIDLNKREELARIFVRHGVVLAYLFGSQAEGKAGPLSDVDIAVLLGPQVPEERWTQVQIDLVNDLISLFHRADVDVAILNRATPLFAYQVVRFGQVLYEDAATRPAVDFAAYAVRRYADTAPLRRLRTQYFDEWVRERYPLVTEPAEPYGWGR